MYASRLPQWNQRVPTSPVWWVSLPSPVRSQIQVISVFLLTHQVDNITLSTLLIGIMYLGYTPFPLSVRNSAVAVAHLVRRMSVRDVIVSPDAGMQRIAHEAKEQLAKEGYELNILPLPQYRDLYNESDDGLDVKMGPLNADKPAVILHSSGWSHINPLDTYAFDLTFI